MKTLKIQRIHSAATIPTYANPGDAGMDLYVAERVVVRPGKITRVPVGIAIQLPKGCAGLIWEKSGLAVNHGIKTLGGVIDEGYRGELVVCLINLGGKAVTLEVGHKVAQMLIQEVHRPRIALSKSLSSSKRGSKGFGSSGK